MDLTLPPRFSFAQFKQVAPVNASNLLEFIIERHGKRITVKRTDAAHENLRKIFDATFKLANRVGFAGMSLRDLCKDTGLSMGGLYGYIASKDDLAAMIEDVIRHVGSEIPKWFNSLPSASDRLDAMLRGHIFMSELLQPWFYFVFMESRSLPQTQKKVVRDSELAFQRDLSRLIIASGVQDCICAEMAAAHCQAVIQDWYVKRWKFKQLNVSVDAFADSVSHLVKSLVRELPDTSMLRPDHT
ncbi:TetR/AcrR family transcriptional regulator [Paraburkholderia aspalathi]|uniref:Transcriptional regulator, TetR family n=1 Tax=Paraburkholderia aspalathi TaxID=1324617 RepID=A0A1I7EAJ8_9BURK|nr:helix-turn-helix domain-containing protein [Paraburkholderia aspalathi]SFU20912.1 transcriptional regulator, TetR family [Paraburkholderia aspalathi]